MRNEFGAQLFGVGVDKMAELGEDGDPDVFRPDGQVQVFVVGLDGGIDQPIRLADDAVREVVG